MIIVKRKSASTGTGTIVPYLYDLTKMVFTGSTGTEFIKKYGKITIVDEIQKIFQCSSVQHRC